MHLVCDNICEDVKIVAFVNPYKTPVINFQLGNTQQINVAMRMHVMLLIDFRML